MAKVRRVKGPGAEKLKVLLKGLKEKQGRAGWFETAKYPNGFPVAAAAAINEFGSPAQGIPPRLGLRPLIKEKTPSWRKTAESGVRAIAAGNADVGTVMEALGQMAAGDIAQRIATVTTPPLKPATIAARRRKMANGKKVGSLTKPLVETGTMLNTVTNDVVNV